MSQHDIRQNITDRIIAGLQQGILPWRRPWSSDPNAGHPKNVISKKPYRGINPLLLELTVDLRGYVSRWWGTYQQWASLGGQVKRRPTDVTAGEWGTQIVLYKSVSKKSVDDEGDEKQQSFRLLKFFTVFNLDQVEGLDHLRPAANHVSAEPDFRQAEIAITATGADIRFGGDRAFYARPTPAGSWPHHAGGDFIQVPPRSQFSSAKEFFGTQFHELVHWSEIRLDWAGSYALGELVAEIGACYIAGELDVPHSDDLDNSTRYLANWLEELKGNPAAILQAAAQAAKATDYILDFSRTREPIIV